MSCLRAWTDSHPLSAFLSLAQIQSPKPSFLKALYNVINCYSSLSSSPLPSSFSPCPSLTTPCSKATILHIVFFLPRMILAPSSSDEIPSMPKSSLNVTEFMRHSADPSPFWLPQHLNDCPLPQDRGYMFIVSSSQTRAKCHAFL